MSKLSGTSGGPVAIRGYLVQTLVALLEIAQADPPFIEITLEPRSGEEQFDFIWTDAKGVHATQVKSTANTFSRSDAEKWATKLEAARSNENCRLVLVGNIPRSLDGIDQLGAVKIETKHFNLADVHEQAAQRLAKFLEGEGINAGTGLQREMVVHALVSQLEHIATRSESLTREAFIKLLRQWINSAPKREVKIDLSHFDVIKYAPAALIGRETETEHLNEAWLQAVRGDPKRPRVLTFVALGGEGKTSLIAKWAADLAFQDWPGCDAVFAWSFYNQGTRDEAAVSSDLFLVTALTFFGDAAMAGSALSAFDKGRRLAHIVGEQRTLLILDGLESLQYAPTWATPGELKDQGIAALLKGLAASSQGLCVVTTRYSLPNLRAFWQTTAPEVNLPHLSRDASVYLLKTLGVNGPAQELETLVEDVKGHALTLTLLGRFLSRAFHGDIRQRDHVKFEKVDEKMDGGHAFRTMASYEQWLLRDGGDEGRRELAVLRLMGLLDRPADAGCLEALRSETISGLTEPLAGLADDDWEYCLTGLETAKLLTVNRNESGGLVSLDAHPLLREYFARQMRRLQPKAWRKAHRRLFEHLCSTTPDKPKPRLEDLEPLYQAVNHACQAGLYRQAFHNIYRVRIQQNDQSYALGMLGAVSSNLTVLRSFFEESWHTPTSALSGVDQSNLLYEVASNLCAAGRLVEAAECMEESYNFWRIRHEARNNLAIDFLRWLFPAGPTTRLRRSLQAFSERQDAFLRANYLCDLKLSLGFVSEAVEHAERFVDYAHAEGDSSRARSMLADALHQAGRRGDARTRFREAEQLQAEHQPAYPQLCSLPGFRYCDLLLAASERAAWQMVLEARARVLHCASPLAPISDADIFVRSSAFGVGSSGGTLHANILRVVRDRATQTIKIAARSKCLLDNALDHLTLGRVALYEAILDSSHSDFRGPSSELDSAVDGLRRAATMHHLPCALLTRACLRYITGARTGPESAQSDLDEAWEISERGPMPLFLVDIHLHRARLFGSRIEESAYPWTSAQQDLVEARCLIEQCGYWRRKEELEDAEEAVLIHDCPRRQNERSLSDEN